MLDNSSEQFALYVLAIKIGLMIPNIPLKSNKDNQNKVIGILQKMGY